MKETPQDYTKRILGHVEGQDALKVQSGTAQKLERLIKGQSAPKLRKRPASGKWSADEILAQNWKRPINMPRCGMIRGV